MVLQLDLHRAAAVVQALNLDTLDSLQCHSAERYATQHHPPLNPDVAALILAADKANSLDRAALKRVLLNQYPATHPVTLVRETADGPPAGTAPCPLDDLDTVPPNGWTALYIPALPRQSSFEHFQDIIAHLRAPEGCPWDQKQTHQSLRPYLLEETYEVLDALDSGSRDDLREELGDLLLQIVLHSQIAVGEGTFRMADIIAAITDKIVRRHPHVWGMVDVNDENDVKVNWDRLKQAEKQDQRQSRLDGVSKSLPALSQAFSYQDRAARVGFDWDTVEPVIAKVHEELDELLTASDNDAQVMEAGDLLFAVVNLARWLDVEPESALRDANARFYRRFSYIEQHAAAQNRPLDDMPLDEMDALWNDAKTNGL
ncbi:MAG: nucleoside triphosphate pyrophosphohydrolase [Anaerolineae bacterium]|nr:nucleoside triphosphate pyrophosphohydrolase [Anaerolineae bacterium]